MWPFNKQITETVRGFSDLKPGGEIECYSEDRDGEVRTTIVKRTPGGTLLGKRIVGWVVVNEDGTSTGSYVKRFFL